MTLTESKLTAQLNSLKAAADNGDISERQFQSLYRDYLAQRARQTVERAAQLAQDYDCD